MDNRYGRTSILKIKTIGGSEGTVLENAQFTAPLKVARPFFKEDGSIEIMVMNSSSGILSGDMYQINIEAGTGSKLEITGQSYTKIHRMEQGMASQNIVINVEKGAGVFYTPPPVIPYAGSFFENSAAVELSDGSAVFLSDVICCGRKMRGEVYQFIKYQSVTKVYKDQKLIFMDNLMLEPQSVNCHGMGWFEGYSHQGTIICFNDILLRKDTTDKIGQIMEGYENVMPGITRISEHGIIVRILGYTAESLEKIIGHIKEYIIKLEGEEDAFNSEGN